MSSHTGNTSRTENQTATDIAAHTATHAATHTATHTTTGTSICHRMPATHLELLHTLQHTLQQVHLHVITCRPHI